MVTIVFIQIFKIIIPFNSIIRYLYPLYVICIIDKTYCLINIPGLAITISVVLCIY